MGSPVTVDSDDLEALMLSSEFGAQVEALAFANQNDAAMMRIRPRMREAANRIRRLRADAIRPHDDPIEDQPLTEAEYLFLEKFDFASPKPVKPTDGIVEHLVRKRMIVLGNASIHWGDKTVEFDGSVWAKVTLKGINAVRIDQGLKPKEITHGQS